MVKTKMQKTIVTCLSIFSLITMPSFAADCLKEKAEFKKLYIELQQKLNYEGKDSYLDKNGNLLLKEHTPKTPYGGVVFEQALYKEYQNALRKVAKVYQSNLNGSSPDSEINTNPDLVNFFKSIEGKESATSNLKIDQIVKELQKISQKSSDKKFAINENDAYLLKKLLTHSQDRMFSVDSYEKTGKGTKLFSADYLEKVKNAPLNRLIQSLKDSKITKDSIIELVDTDKAINSAILENLNNLTNWMKKNEKCRKSISNPNYIQLNIQNVNYQYFLNCLQNLSNSPLSDGNAKNLEAILHFINANEKLLNKPQAKAETSLDELKLEAYIDQTFANMGKKIACSEVASVDKKSKKIFVRNLPWDEATNKFKTDSIVCKIQNKEIKNCAEKIELVSDELGRGVEIRQKDKKAALISFSIKGNTDCQNIDIGTPPEPVNPVTPVTPVTPVIPDVPTKPLEGKALCDKQIDQNRPNILFRWDADSSKPNGGICTSLKDECEKDSKKLFNNTGECVDKTPVEDQAFCEAKNEKDKPVIFKWDVDSSKPNGGICVNKKEVCEKEETKEFNDKGECVEKKPAEDKTTCEAKNEKDKPIIFKWDVDITKPNGGICVDKKAECEKDTKKEFNDKGECVEKKPTEDKTACEAKNEKDKPVLFKWDIDTTKPNGGICVDKKAECEKDTKKEFNDKGECVLKTEKKDPEQACIKKNDDWIKEQTKDGEAPSNRYEWSDDKKQCVDLNKKPGSKDSDEEEGPPAPSASTEPNLPVPKRFTPVQIPTRQMFILPGMM